MEETRKPTNGKPKPHSQIIKDIDARIIRLEKLIRDDEIKRRGLRVWFLKRKKPELWEEMNRQIQGFKDMIKSEKERKRILEIELQGFIDARQDKTTQDFIEKYQQDFNVDYETAKAKVLAMRKEFEAKRQKQV